MRDFTPSAEDIILSKIPWTYNISVQSTKAITPEKKKRPKKPPTDERVPQMVTVNQLAELTELHIALENYASRMKYITTRQVRKS